MALSNALIGSNGVPALHDINANFNSTYGNWYYGTDQNPPGGTYDLVSVIMHELGHGLGFSGSMTMTGASDAWGLSGDPYAYDRFTENGSGQDLLNMHFFQIPRLRSACN